MTLLDKARRVFESDRYAVGLSGIALTAVGTNNAECRLTLGADHCNARGVAMGGVLFTMADFCAAVAANSGCVESDTDLQWVSLDATIHYLCPAAQSATLVACCRPLKTGRTTALMQTEIKDLDSSRTVAIVETTMIRI